MKTVLKPSLHSKSFSIGKTITNLPKKEVNLIPLIDNKFYQKLFVVLIALSTILIFPEAPKELEAICEVYNSKELCNVW